MSDYFAADVHLAPERPEVTARFLRFLDMVPERARRLFLLGDIFDFWVGEKQRQLDHVRPVLDALAAVERSGVAVTYLAGNRDFNFRANGSPAADDLSIESAGKRLHLSHGDLLCTADRNYRKARRMVRSRPVRALLAHMPLGMAGFFSGGYMRLSRRIVARKPRREKAVDFASVKRHLLEGHDVVVCGHVHRAARYRVDLGEGRRGEFITLGDWVRRGIYLVGGEDGLHLRAFP